MQRDKNRARDTRAVLHESAELFIVSDDEDRTKCLRHFNSPAPQS